MKKSNNKPLRFDTQKNVRATHAKRFAAAFSCFFVLLGGISVLLLLNHYDFNLSALKDPAANETTLEQTTAQPAPVVEGKRTYLLFCTSAESNTLRFAALLHADMDELVLSLEPIDPSRVLSASGCTGTPEQQLDFGGNAQLVAAVEAAYSVDVYKFVRSTDNGFKSIINSIGGFEVNVEEAIDIRSESLTAIIGKGLQTMTGDTALKYIRAFESNPRVQAEIIAEMFEQKITATNFNKADTLYSKIINLVESDISVLDFAQIKNSFKALLADEAEFQVEILN